MRHLISIGKKIFEEIGVFQIIWVRSRANRCFWAKNTGGGVGMGDWGNTGKENTSKNDGK